MRENFIFTRAAELDALPVFRDFIAQAGERLRLSNECCFDLQDWHAMKPPRT